MPSLAPWFAQWPLPSPQELLERLAGHQPLTAVDRLAWFRDGQAQALERGLLTPDTGLRVTAQGVLTAGSHGQQRPACDDPHAFHGAPRPQPTIAWPDQVDSAWPAWDHDDPERFAQRAHLALWLASGANPWLPWGEDRQGPWGLPEMLLVEGDVGLLRRVLEHPAAPSLEALATRRLAPASATRSRTHAPWLHAAAAHPDPGVLDELLCLGLDPNQPDDLGRTPLFYASSAQHMERLLQAGAHVEACDRAGESVRRYWSAHSGSYARDLAPVLDAWAQQAPTASTVASMTVEETFGHGARGQWDKVLPVFERVGDDWNGWRQPLATKKGQAREASWLGFSALGLLSKDMHQRPVFNWSAEECWVLAAGEYTRATATPDSLAHETLPGLPDGLLWTWALMDAHYLQPPLHLRSGLDSDQTWRMEIRRLEEVHATLCEQWLITASPDGQPVLGVAQLLRGLSTNINTWGAPSFWRNAISSEIHSLFELNDRHKASARWLRALDQFVAFRGWPKNQPDPAGEDEQRLRQQWHVMWTAVAHVMLNDKAVRASSMKRVIEALGPLTNHNRAEDRTAMAESLCPMSVRPLVASACWLALAEGETHPYGSDRPLDQFRRVWDEWSKAGVRLDTSALGVRGQAVIQAQFPNLIQDLAPASRRSRRPGR